MTDWLIALLPLLMGWLLDLVLGDPAWLPHPVVGFGKMIAVGERHLNQGSRRRLKGALMTVLYITGVFAAVWFLRNRFCIMSDALCFVFDMVVIFYCLAGTTLIREVRAVFLALDRSPGEGRRQVARIVGRDTSELSAQEVRTAALETLAENLSDGVIAPLFWFALLGVPGMLAYKMVNTLDSMIGYKTDRYRDFGCWAAHIDDIANYIPARLTALLMIIGFEIGGLRFEISSIAKVTSNLKSQISNLKRFGRNHASPNSGYPEAALAGILDCRFGGPHYYFGQLFPKPFIGENDRPLTTADMKKAVRVNRLAEIMMVILIIICTFVASFLTISI